MPPLRFIQGVKGLGYEGFGVAIGPPKNALVAALSGKKLFEQTFAVSA